MTAKPKTSRQQTVCRCRKRLEAVRFSACSMMAGIMPQPAAAVHGECCEGRSRGRGMPCRIAGSEIGRYVSRGHAADGTSAAVRLGGWEDGAVEVRSCAVKNRAVSNRNCVAEMRGGEQRNENDQSETEGSGKAVRGELDSVGVSGRAFDRVAKPVGAGVNPLAAGRTPVGTLMVGVGMVGSLPRITRETRREQAEFMARAPEEPPDGSQSVRSSEESGNDRGAKGRRKVDA